MSARKEVLVLLTACVALFPIAGMAASATVVRNYQFGNCAHPASSAANALVQVAVCNGADTQMWAAEYVDKGGYGTSGVAYFRLRNVQSRLCLDLQSATNANGTKLVQKACSNATTQQWTAPYTFTASGAVGKSEQTYQSFQNSFSGKCLDEPATGSGPLQIWTCGSVDNQQWFIAD